MGQTQSNYDISAVVDVLKKSTEHQLTKQQLDQQLQASTRLDIIPDTLADTITIILLLHIIFITTVVYAIYKKMRSLEHRTNDEDRHMRHKMSNYNFNRLHETQIPLPKN